MKEELAFGDRQDAYFNDQISGEIIVNPGIEYDTLPSSLQQPNVNIPIPVSLSSKRIMNRFHIDPTNQYTDADKKFCRTASHPSKLPTRPRGTTVACGWWFVLDPSVPSIGTLGTKDKPLFPETLPTGGEWIWDIPTAIMKEDIKRCKQINTCELVDTKALKGVCGFCPNLGYSVPVTSNGADRYPNIVTCGTMPIRDSKSCPKPPAASIKTPEGHDCGNYGYPSSDNYIRLYSREDCSAIDPDANFAGNGECLKPEGGSYSWDCRTLNTPVVNEPSICDPKSDGRLSRACLIYLCKGMGYTPAGAVLRILNDPLGKPNEIDIVAMDIMKSIAVPVPNALIGGGDIDKESAKNLYYKLMLATYNGRRDDYREAAKWLVFGSNKFDPCDIPDTVRGPFIQQCIQREFRKAGCQPAGTKYPTKPEDFGKYYDYKWRDVKNEFAALRNKMSNKDGAVQDIAVKQCLGVGVERARPSPCINGVFGYKGTRASTITIQTVNNVTTVVASWNIRGTVSFDPAKLSGVMQFTNGWRTDFTMKGNTINWKNGGAQFSLL